MNVEIDEIVKDATNDYDTDFMDAAKALAGVKEEMVDEELAIDETTKIPEETITVSEEDVKSANERKATLDAREKIRQAFLNVAGIFSPSGLTYNFKEHKKQLAKDNPEFVQAYNKKSTEKETGTYKTALEKSIASKFGEDFMAGIKGNNTKMLVCAQILNQIKQTENLSKIDFTMFRADYSPAKLSCIFEAQKQNIESQNPNIEPIDVRVFEYLSDKACNVVLNAIKNGIKGEKLKELLRTRDSEMEAKMLGFIKASGKTTAHLQIINEAGSVDDKFANLDELIKTHEKASDSKDGYERKNLHTKNGESIDDR